MDVLDVDLDKLRINALKCRENATTKPTNCVRWMEKKVDKHLMNMGINEH